MSLFSSKREKHLWIWALIAQASIYATLRFAGKLAQFLRERNILDAIYVFGFLLAVIAVIGSGWRMRLGKHEIWVALGIVATYGMLMVRLFITPEERTHLFEYGIVATLIHQALLERQRNRNSVFAPVLFAILVTALLGWLDEGIQAILPNRVYDIRDVGFNALAGLMAVMASVALNAVRKKISKQ